MLRTSDPEELKQYLLMERIFPPAIQAHMLRRGQLKTCLSYSELGIYSSVIIDTTLDDIMIENLTYGRLLRTKSTESDEGGINTGFSVID